MKPAEDSTTPGDLSPLLPYAGAPPETMFQGFILSLALILISVAALALTFICAGPSHRYVGSGPLFFSRTDFGDPVFLTLTIEENPRHIMTRSFDFHPIGCLTVALSLLLIDGAAILLIRRVWRRRPRLKSPTGFPVVSHIMAQSRS